MGLNYEELDFTSTTIGDLLLRRRRMIQFGDLDIYEVKLGEEYLGPIPKFRSAAEVRIEFTRRCSLSP